MTKSRSVVLLDGQAPPRVRNAPTVRHNSWEDASDLAAAFGLILDPWQEDVLRAGLGERANGDWAVRQVGVSVPRQNGKTQIIVARILAGLLLFKERLIIVSAQRQDTARETWNRLVQIIEDHPSLEDRVEFIGRSENREYVKMKTGQRVEFKARSGPNTRGRSPECLMLDEAQMVSPEAWASILPAMSAQKNGQMWLLGTPPDPGIAGEVFTRIREASAKESRIAWIEWSAADDDDIDDPETWAKANPAYGTRVDHEAIAVERASLSDAQFKAERLGMWNSGETPGVIPADSWDDREDRLSLPVARYCLGVECGPDMASTSIALAGQREDGEWHVELEDLRKGSDWLVPKLVKLLANNPQVAGPVVDVAGPIKALLEQRGKRWLFKGTQIEAFPVKVDDLGSACSTVLNLAVAGGLRHIGQPQLTAAATTAGKRPLGDTGRWVWSRKTSVQDITPIQAATLALWGAQSDRIRPKQASERKVVVMSW